MTSSSFHFLSLFRSFFFLSLCFDPPKWLQNYKRLDFFFQCVFECVFWCAVGADETLSFLQLMMSEFGIQDIPLIRRWGCFNASSPLLFTGRLTVLHRFCFNVELLSVCVCVCVCLLTQPRWLTCGANKAEQGVDSRDLQQISVLRRRGRVWQSTLRVHTPKLNFALTRLTLSRFTSSFKHFHLMILN